MRRSGINNPVFEIADGREAIVYFIGKGLYARRDEFPITYLVLMDLKLPYVMGFDVLKWLKSQPALRHLQIIG